MKIFWLLPFIFFILGYYASYKFFYIKSITVPNIIGRSLEDGLEAASRDGLGVKVIQTKEGIEFPEHGLVIDQIPRGGSKLRVSFPLKIIVAKKSKPKLALECLGKGQKQISNITAKEGIKVKLYFVESNLNKGTCIAQSPCAGEPIDKYMIIYLSSGGHGLHTVPDLYGMPLEEAKDILKKFNLKFKTFYKNSNKCKHCKVVEQNPVKGSLIDVKKDHVFQLLVN